MHTGKENQCHLLGGINSGVSWEVVVPLGIQWLCVSLLHPAAFSSTGGSELNGKVFPYAVSLIVSSFPMK